MIIINYFRKNFLLPLMLLICLLSAFMIKPVELPNGTWRATIERKDGKKIVFNFITKDSAGKKILYVINGKEHLLVDSIISRDDSLFIQMPFFESGFAAKLNSDGNLQGEWIKHYGKRILRLPFEAEFNNKNRFKVTAPPVANISGTWVSTFTSGNRTSTFVTTFHQDGHHLSGAVLNPTGDFRFLDGVVSGDSLKLSTFDGGNAYLLTAKIDNQNTISGGKFYAGATGVSEWTSKRNDTASVTDNFNNGTALLSNTRLNFSFPDSKTGKMISINNDRFKNKVVVVQI